MLYGICKCGISFCSQSQAFSTYPNERLADRGSNSHPMLVMLAIIINSALSFIVMIHLGRMSVFQLVDGGMEVVLQGNLAVHSSSSLVDLPSSRSLLFLSGDRTGKGGTLLRRGALRLLLEVQFRPRHQGRLLLSGRRQRLFMHVSRRYT
jgi:hypothetical protein